MKDIEYRMKDNWIVKVTAKKEVSGVVKWPTFKFDFQISATVTFLEIERLVRKIVQDRLGDYWNATEVHLSMAGY